MRKHLQVKNIFNLKRNELLLLFKSFFKIIIIIVIIINILFYERFNYFL